MKLFGLKNCDTCRKALNALKAAGHEPDFHDLRVNGVTKAYVTKWAKAVGWETLLNTRSTTWRELEDGEKTNLTQAKAVELMAAKPTLIKRPVIESEAGVTCGWTDEARARHAT